MASLNTRNWSATESSMPVGIVKLHVAGEVETPSVHELPALTRAVPQGFNPRILILNLSVEDTGDDGAKIVDFRRTRYEEECRPQQFSQVQVNWERSLLQMIDVKRAP